MFSKGSQEGLMARPQSRLDVCCSLYTRLHTLISYVLLVVHTVWQKCWERNKLGDLKV